MIITPPEMATNRLGNAVWVGAKLPRHDFLAARPLVAAEPEAFPWTEKSGKGRWLLYARVYCVGKEMVRFPEDS